MSGVTATAPAPQAVLGFDDGAFHPIQAPAGDPRVADSWLVDDGRVVAWALHVDRYVRSVEAQGGDAALAAQAAAAVPVQLPAEGRWFPRLDWVDGPVLRVRPAPATTRRVRVRTAATDPRTIRTVKGPDLSALGALREEARAHGADEAIVLDGGLVADGATSAVLWWRDDVLHVPAEALERVDSVTCRAVLCIAAARGVAVRAEGATPEALAGCETWIVNALHGVRGVEAWVGGPVLAAPDRADAWHAAVEGLGRAWT